MPGPYQVSLSGLEAALASRTALAQESSRRTGEALRNLHETLLTTRAQVQQERQFQEELELRRRELGLRVREFEERSATADINRRLAEIGLQQAQQEQRVKDEGLRRILELERGRIPTAGSFAPVLPPPTFEEQMKTLTPEQRFGPLGQAISQVESTRLGVRGQAAQTQTAEARAPFAGPQAEADIELSRAQEFAARAGGEAALVRAEVDLAEIKAKYGTDAANQAQKFADAVMSVADGKIPSDQLDNLESAALKSAQFALDPRNPRPLPDPVEFIKNFTGIDIGIKGQGAARRALERSELQEEEGRPSPETERIQAKITGEIEALKSAQAAGVSEEEISEELFRAGERFQKSELAAVKSAQEKLAAKGVDSKAVLNVYRRERGINLLEHSKLLFKIESGKLVKRPHIEEKEAEEFLELMKMLGFTEENIKANIR